MSEQANVAKIGQIYDAFNRGEIGYILDQLSDDVAWKAHLDQVVPWGGDFSGKENVPRFFEAIGNSVDVQSFTPGEFVSQGDTVVSTGTFGFKVRATGKTGLTRWAFIWKLEDGKVASYEQFHEPALAAPFH